MDVMLSSSQRVGMKADLYNAHGNITSRYRYADENLRVAQTEATITINRHSQVFGFDNEEKRPFIILFLDNTQEENTSDGIRI